MGLPGQARPSRRRASWSTMGRPFFISRECPTVVVRGSRVRKRNARAPVLSTAERLAWGAMDLKNRIVGKTAFTRLYARIREEDGAFTVNVRLQNHLKPDDAAWGQEIAVSIEMASSMIAALAQEFSIPQECISIDIGMENYRDGTRH